MRNKIIAILGVTLFVCVGIISYFDMQLTKAKEERDKYKTNTYTLLQKNKQYITNDSLNAIEVGTLELKLSEFEKYRANDAKTIKSLEIKNRKLDNVTTTQTQTINSLRGTFRDSLVYLNAQNEQLTAENKAQATRIDTLSCITISDKWFELNGCTNQYGEFNGVHINRDSLLIAGTTKYKRFLGFLWYTNKVKDRKIDVISKNPATKILGAEYIEVK